MSDSDAYSYEYDEDDSAVGDDANEDFNYSDDDEGNNAANTDEQEGEVALENGYYNAKASRDNGDLEEAREEFENVVRMEIGMNKKAAGAELEDDHDVDTAAVEDAMDVDNGSGNSRSINLTPLKYHGPWSYKSIKQLVKLHLRTVSSSKALKDYERMLRVASSPSASISPNAVEKGVNGMLERVANLINSGAGEEQSSSGGDENDPKVLAKNVYDLTLKAFHPTTGISPNERLWFKTNLKYGQLLYEMNETGKLQMVINDLLSGSGQNGGESGMEQDTYGGGGGGTTSSGGTHLMEIAALQIQLYSRLKDTKKLRAAYHSAMAVRGGIPHPRTIALIQELGGKMHMSQRNFDEACQAFFQAFKSYDEAGDRARLRCLKYLVMASMLHASSINPFDSHEARAHREDPEIVAMTTLVDAFHNDDIRKFEKILNKNEGRVMDDEFVKEHVSDLLRTLRTQVILNTFEPYTRIRLERISKDLNGIPIEDVESLLVSLILDEKLEGRIDQVSGILVKTNQSVGGGAASSRGDGKMASGSIQSRNTSSIVQLTAALEHLNGAISKASYVV